MRLIICMSLLLISSASMARKPAVEDFVGIEYEEVVPATGPGTEALFNFETDMITHQSVDGVPQKNEIQAYSWNQELKVLAVIVMLLSMPAFSFYWTKRKQKKTIQNVTHVDFQKKADKKKDSFPKAS